MPSPSSRAHASMGCDAWLENVIGTPHSRAARATARSALRSTISSTPMGDRTNGEARRRPNSSRPVSRSPTSRSIRGTIRQRPKSSRLDSIVRPLPAPPAM